jgi:hypothetical protein
VEDLPIALHDFRLGVDKIIAGSGTPGAQGSRVTLRAFTRGVRDSVAKADPGLQGFFGGMQVGLARAAKDEFRLPLAGSMIRDKSQERFAGGLVAGALLHEWLRADRRAISELTPMYDYGQGVGFQVNQHHLCAHDAQKTLLVHRVCCVYVEQRHGGIPIHTEMFLVAWLLRVCGYPAEEVDMEGYLADRIKRWNWMPPRATPSAP